MFHIETIKDLTVPTGLHYRVTDGGGNRVATCYEPENASMIANALNFARTGVRQWVCGHTARSVCEQCYRAAVESANKSAPKG